ncbi:hypothetical protein [Saccharothrix syringae]|uniref:hypothetical protein n=1 Tax=Saccharothrix syringae TaxID=103733 RepID=UPI0012938FFA|nr:hypothetical protein [Saccharothrix syringae]
MGAVVVGAGGTGEGDRDSRAVGEAFEYRPARGATPPDPLKPPAFRTARAT